MKEKLAVAVRDVADQFREDAANKEDVRELLLVLARVLEGKPVERAFGAPGDWGYDTPIGDALAGR